MEKISRIYQDLWKRINIRCFTTLYYSFIGQSKGIQNNYTVN